VVPIAIAGIAAGAYYIYRNGEKSPVAAAMISPSKPVLTNPEEWIDFKVLSPIYAPESEILQDGVLIGFSWPKLRLLIIIQSCLRLNYQIRRGVWGWSSIPAF